MFYEMFSFIVEIVAGILGGFLLLRFWMQALRLRPPNSLGLAIFQITDWLVKPIRRLVPGFGGFDWASLIGAFLVAFLSILLESLFTMQHHPGIFLLLALLRLCQWVIYGLMALLVLEAILSFVNPYAPIAPLIRALNQPILSPLRRIIPPIGGIDFSVLVALIILQLLGRVLMSALPNLYFYLA
ncbi:YggT family protein [Undibacterium fentianense]|uniref:YggT family protein n=1 Tax=Undibacterium fentianense TaxID=2828728 RepID=A0A941E665_9BURK|nr:YggT family protein [Undibacterium fentianense]MBR7799463.1 YggT family protein [Undibacterium fentianense]